MAVISTVQDSFKGALCDYFYHNMTERFQNKLAATVLQLVICLCLIRQQKTVYLLIQWGHWSPLSGHLSNLIYSQRFRHGLVSKPLRKKYNLILLACPMFNSLQQPPVYFGSPLFCTVKLCGLLWVRYIAASHSFILGRELLWFNYMGWWTHTKKPPKEIKKSCTELQTELSLWGILSICKPFIFQGVI